jgi:hypothetical protein
LVPVVESAVITTGSIEMASSSMPRTSDGPPSGGRRYGGLSALRANLPPAAANPRGIVTDENVRKRQALADFAAYPERAKSIGKPLPETQGVSQRRAAILKKIQESNDQPAERSVTLRRGKFHKLKLVFDSTSKRYRFVREDTLLGCAQHSLSYGSRDQAMLYYRLDMIRWTNTKTALPRTD